MKTHFLISTISRSASIATRSRQESARGRRAQPCGIRGVAPETEQRLHRAVDRQIGVAPDRGGEVRVVPEGQREVPADLHLVAGLTHAAQRHLVDEPLLGSAGGPAQGLRDLHRRELAPRARRHEPEACQQLAQRFEILRSRRLVIAVDRGQTRRVERFGHGAIRREHRLLDGAMRDAARRLDDVDRLRSVAEHDLGARQIEVDRACGAASREQRLGDPPQQAQLLGHLAALPRRGRPPSITRAASS